MFDQVETGLKRLTLRLNSCMTHRFSQIWLFISFSLVQLLKFITKICIPKQFPYFWIYMFASFHLAILPLLCVAYGEYSPWYFLQSMIAILCPAQHCQPLLKACNSGKCRGWRAFFCENSNRVWETWSTEAKPAWQCWPLGGSEITVKLVISHQISLHSIHASTEHGHWNQGCWPWNNYHLPQARNLLK